MIARVRDLVASDPSTLNPVIGLLATANFDQATAIGTGLGQAALMVVKTDQAYANQIQDTLAAAMNSRGGSNGRSLVDAGTGSGDPKIGNAITTKDQVDGVTEKGEQAISPGSVIYANELVRTGTTGKAELLFADRTNLSIAPVTEIRLDKFVYDPNGGRGNVVVVATTGAFRFITGVQAHESYEIKTPFATMGVRGTEFLVLITPDNVKVELLGGEVTVTTISGKAVTLSTANTVLSIDSQGNTQGPTGVNQPLVNFADLGKPVTNISVADALAAFSSVTGSQSTGSTGSNGGGGGGGGGEGSATTGSSGGGGALPISPSNFSVTSAPTEFSTFSFTSSSTGSRPGANMMTDSVSHNVSHSVSSSR